MFDFGIGYTELMVIALVAVIVIGPKDLPKVLRAFGRTTAKLRTMAREFQGHLDQAMREAGVDDVKKEIANLKSMNPIPEVKKELDKVAEATKAPVAEAKKSIESEAKKQDDDFKKYFGELGVKPADQPKLPDPPKPAEAAAIEAPKAEATTIH
jgi:sec-independent protein translocase protein TatB